MFCKTRFLLPKIDNIEHTETVYLFQYSTWGHHSLGFHRQGQLVEFTYGDWDMFALNKRDLKTAVFNMTWPTQGALGRKSVTWQPSEPAIPKFKDCIKIVPFKAPIELTQKLYSQLELAFAQTVAQQVYHKEDDLYFVPYPVKYALWHNCNHELVTWLQSLGGHVSGKIFWNPDFILGMSPKLNSIH